MSVHDIHSSLLTYLIQSSAALDGAGRVIELDDPPIATHASLLNHLRGTLESARVFQSRHSETREALFGSLVIYLIKSSFTLNETLSALATNPQHASLFVLMSISLDSAKVLLTRVCTISTYSLDCFAEILLH
jgi:hypothetical protein